MPFRSSSLFLAARLQRQFHSSVSSRIRHGKNYYEILHVPNNATPAEVKKSFYALSKTHHPDRNPNDPHASERFVEISEAYATLSIPAKKQAYDREHIHTHHQSSHGGHHRPTGSYSSTHSPAGGRPASGLSRRRTQFRGPPPSFYRSGGWGEHSAKRRAAQDNGAPGAERPDFGENVHASSGGGGMGFGDRPVGHDTENDVPHFDREGHFRTHQNQDRRRRRRGYPGEDYGPANTGGMLANFVFVGAIIGLAALIPTVMLDKMGSTRSGDKR